MQRTIALMFLAVTILVSQGCAFAQSAPKSALDRIRQTKTIRIAYRVDAPPFSFKTGAGEPAGFIVDLCRAVSARIGQQLGIPTLNVSYVVVTATDRFDAISQGKADMLCEPTSATLSRRKVVDFSIPTYVDGAGILVQGNGPRRFEDLAGKSIGVLAGTTTEQALRNTLRDTKITAAVVEAKTHDEGVAMLQSGKISAYFADRTILEGLVFVNKAANSFQIADSYMTIEPYALALPHGDEDFRLAVDTALSHIYRSGEIVAIFNHTFPGARPSTTLQTLFTLSAYPE